MTTDVRWGAYDDDVDDGERLSGLGLAVAWLVAVAVAWGFVAGVGWLLWLAVRLVAAVIG